MKTIKNNVFTALTIIFLTTVFLVAACVNSVLEDTYKTEEERETINIPEGKGAILLKFVDDARETIMPDVPYDDLTYTVEISVAGHGVISINPGLSLNRTTVESIPIYLETGNYTINVFGYLENEAAAAYVGEEPATVSIGGLSLVPIKLKGNAYGTTGGTLTYSITPPVFNPASVCDSITMDINSVTGTFSMTGIDVKANPSQLASSSVPAGYYRITITYTRTNYEVKKVTWILHIYSTMNTHFQCDLPPLTRTDNLNVLFDAKGGFFEVNNSERSPAYFVAKVGDIYPEIRSGIYGGIPATPTNLDNTLEFEYWCHDSAGTIPWVFGTDRVYENYTVIWARWTEKSQYTVTFNTNTGADAFDYYVQTVHRGNTINGSLIPDPSGYNPDSDFVGWFKDVPGTLWDFNNAIYSDTTLYALWDSGRTEIEIPETGIEEEGDYVIYLDSVAWRQGFRIIAPAGTNSPSWHILEYPAYTNTTNDFTLFGVENGHDIEDIFITAGLTMITVEYRCLQGTWTFTISFRASRDR